MHRFAIAAVLLHLTAIGLAQTWSPFPQVGTGVFGTVSASTAGLISVARSSGSMVVHEWDGLNWVQRASPPARDGFALAYDSIRQRVVLFGGYSSSTNPPTWFADTWEWNGANWIPRVSATFPTARSMAQMTFDSGRGRVVLFGGQQGGTPTFLSDTWEWDGLNWTQTATAPSPPGRIHHAMAFDPIRQRTILFGGWAWGLFGDTWEWDGLAWIQRSPAVAPSPRWEHAMCFDPYSGGVLLFGGESCSSGASTCVGWPIPLTPSNDAHVWTGSSWVPKTYYLTPSPRSSHSMVLDESHQLVVVLGGSTADPAWKFPGTIAATAQPFGAACGALSLTASALPVLGQQTQGLLTRPGDTIGIPFMSLGFSEQMLGPFLLPLPLDGFGFTGCWLHHDTVALGLPCAIIAPDQGAYSFTIPNDIITSGQRVYLQGLSVVPAANPGGIVTSNALRLVLGNF